LPLISLEKNFSGDFLLLAITAGKSPAKSMYAHLTLRIFRKGKKSSFKMVAVFSHSAYLEN
jgi:hypothetical protein